MGVFSSEDSNAALEVDKVAPFLLKLYEIVSSPVSDDLVCWSEHGETFKIVNRTKFAGVSRAPPPGRVRILLFTIAYSPYPARSRTGRAPPLLQT